MKKKTKKVCLHGSPGNGKSDLVFEWAKTKGMRIYTLYTLDDWKRWVKKPLRKDNE